ncbi:MAG: 16S rRNA (cytosine(967)-C(5))-methyltransferase RsmB, partial [Gemmatimonadetes bacterium]|nr:16S rRNA (cytosine(967)-C(5))-methyltransferase RsmB [Gemmatimonadota bacterium]
MGRSPSAAVSVERQLADRILAQVDEGRRLDVAWEALGAGRSPARSWLRHLIYGTVRLRGRLDHVLGRFLRRPLASLDGPVLRVLRQGAFQVLYMDSVPDYAAVSESVALVRRSDSASAAGLVNAVLRKVAAVDDLPGLFPGEDDLPAFLTTWGSHPEWLVDRWLQAFGEEETRALVEANNTEPHVYLHPVGLSEAEARVRLAAAGIESVAEGGLLRLDRETDPAAALRLVPAVVQDPAAAWVTRFAAPPDNGLVADVCAAPGGKALVLSRGFGARRPVLAGDRSAVRLRRVVRAAARLEAPVWPVVMDARQPPLRRADLVLVDAPCSGTGTLRRHPDARWRVQPDDVATLSSLQEAILEGCAPLVPPDGLLVYATCTLEDEENVS